MANAKFEQKSEWATEKREAVKRLDNVREDARLFFNELKSRCVDDAKTIGGRVRIEMDPKTPGEFSITAAPFLLKVVRLPSGGIQADFYKGAALGKTEIYIPLNLNGDLGYKCEKEAFSYKDMPEELIKKVLDAEAALG